MTETEKSSLIEQIEDFGAWMKDSSGHGLSETDITELIENDDDIYEVYVIVHLINGEQILLRNRCFDSFMRETYVGDTIHFLGNGALSDINNDDYVEIHYNDIHDDTFHQCKVPLSSICYIEGYNIRLNWSNLYEYIWKKRNGE